MKSGIILVNKPKDVTSFDCIRALKRAWKRTDLGHCGTLDKFATGLLPIMAGDGLKLVRFFLESYPQLPTYWKTYRGVIILGAQTETGDPEGAIIASGPVPESVTDAAIAGAMQSFTRGDYEQTPPAYSAKKIGGERASDLARDGKLTLDMLKPVKVIIRKFELVGTERTADGRMRVSFQAECSKGTYVRRLAEDLGIMLGTFGFVEELCRTQVGNYSLIDATPLDELCSKTSEEAILGMRMATEFLPRLPALDVDVNALKTGRFHGLAARLANSGGEPNVYCATTQTDELPVALLQLDQNSKVQFLRAFEF